MQNARAQSQDPFTIDLTILDSPWVAPRQQSQAGPAREDVVMVEATESPEPEPLLRRITRANQTPRGRGVAASRGKGAKTPIIPPVPAAPPPVLIPEEKPEKTCSICLDPFKEMACPPCG